MKKIYLLIMLVLPLLLVGFGCSTGGSASKAGEAPGDYTTLTHGDITVRLSYLTQKDLYKLYSSSNNPYITYKSGALVVIDTVVQSGSPVSLQLENAQLSSPGGIRGPVPKQEVHDYWYSKLIKNYSSYKGGKGGGIYSNWSLKVTTQRIEEQMHPDTVNVSPGSETAGYIAFDPVPGEKEAQATLVLPVYDQNGKQIHEFEFRFSL